MLSHRLRTLGAIVPALMLAGLLAVNTSFAAHSLRITSPVSGTTVAGMFDVTGTADGDAAMEIAVGLAPQAFGECAATVLEQPAVVDVFGAFAASIPSATVADGMYCVVVTVDDGRLSTALGDLTVDNALDRDETLAQIANAHLLAPVVVGAAATLAIIVLVLALLQRRRSE